MGRAYEVRKASIQKTGAAKGKVYSMYAKEIYLAAKQGGTELESNASLKRLVERAKKEQVPGDIIKRAIDKVNSGADESYIKNVYQLSFINDEKEIEDFLKNKLGEEAKRLYIDVKEEKYFKPRYIPWRTEKHINMKCTCTQP